METGISRIADISKVTEVAKLHNHTGLVHKLTDLEFDIVQAAKLDREIKALTAELKALKEKFAELEPGTYKAMDVTMTITEARRFADVPVDVAKQALDQAGLGHRIFDVVKVNYTALKKFVSVKRDVVGTTRRYSFK